jgi:hypothetical protein
MRAAVVLALLLRGRVLERPGDRPVGGALVQLLRSDSTLVASAITDADGAFSIRTMDALPAGGYLYIGRLGYLEARVPLNTTTTDASVVVIHLDADPVAIAAVDVRGTARNPALDNVGFYRRQRVGIGRFITRDMLETGRYSTERKVIDMLRRVPGVTHAGERPDGGYAYLRAPQMAMRADTAFCHATFFVDGMPQGTQLQPLNTYDVEAVEVYVGPSQVPAQFTVMGSMCGAVLIWMRTGTSRE